MKYKPVVALLKTCVFKIYEHSEHSKKYCSNVVHANLAIKYMTLIRNQFSQVKFVCKNLDEKNNEVEKCVVSRCCKTPLAFPPFHVSRGAIAIFSTCGEALWGNPSRLGSVGEWNCVQSGPQKPVISS